MILLEARIEGFGTYRDREIPLHPGLNIIHGKNESGKTTMTRFVESVLYGFSDAVSEEAAKDREKYKPWDGGSYKGTLVYDCQGHRIAVTRDFADDTLRMTDLDSGQDLTPYLSRKNVIERLSPDNAAFRISPAAYRNAVSVVQGHADASLAAVHGDLEESAERASGSDTASVRKSMARLQERLSVIGSTDEAEGRLGALRAREEALTGQIRQNQANRRQREQLLKELQALPEKVEKEENASWIVENAGTRNQKDRLAAWNEETKALYEQVEALQETPAVSRDEYEELLALSGQIRSAEDRSTKAKDRLKKEGGSTDFAGDSDTVAEETSELKKNTLQRGIPVLAVLIAGIVLTVLGYSWGAAFIGGAAGVLALILWQNTRKAEEIRAAQARQDVRRNYADQEQAATEELQELQKQKEQILAKADAATIEAYRDLLEQDSVNRRMRKDLEDLYRRRQEWVIATADTILSSHREELTEQIEKLADTGDMNEIRRELADAGREKERLEAERNSLLAAAEAIRSLSREIRHEFAPTLAANMKKTLGRITDGRYPTVMLSEQGDLQIFTVDGRILGIDQVSAGTQDQIYLALRLAIMDCLSPDEKLPLILDDAFARYDEDRLEQVLRILAGEAEERQILIFTCQNREIDTLKRLKQDYSLLELQAQ